MKVTGLYRYYDDEKDVRMYVYTYEDSNGNIKYGFTDDVDKAKKLTFDLFKTKGCKTEKEIDKKINDDNFNLDCRNKKELFMHIKKANKNLNFNSNEFDKAKAEYDKKAKGTIYSRILNKGKNLGSTVLNLPKKALHRFKDLPPAKKIVYSSAFVAITLAIGIGGLSLNKSKSPTSKGPKEYITSIDDLDKDIDKTKEQPKEEKTTEEAAVTTEEVIVTAEQSGTEYYTYDNVWTQPVNNESNVAPTPNIVDESLGGFQEPTNIDDSTNTSTPPTEGETPDDPYGNVSEKEEDNNYQEGETPDNDYSEELDVPVGGEDETTNEDNITFDDEHKGNEGSIDILPGDSDYEIDFVEPNTPLPDPNNTANGDYVTSEDELQQNNNDQQSSEIIEEENTTEVPVYQENVTTTNTTVTTMPTDLETAVDNAVEAMANGETGNIVVNADGRISFEDINTIEANGMTK